MTGEPLLSLLYGLQTAVTPFMTLFYEPTLNVWFNRWMCAAALLAMAVLIAMVVSGDRPVRGAGLFWLGWFIHATLLPFARIAEARGERARAEAWRARAAEKRNRCARGRTRHSRHSPCIR